MPKVIGVDYDNGKRTAVYVQFGDEKERFVAESKWISVEERLPDTVDDVLVCRKNGYVQVNYMLMPGKWRYGSVEVNPITHWMPLPEPPEVDTP